MVEVQLLDEVCAEFGLRTPELIEVNRNRWVLGQVNKEFIRQMIAMEMWLQERTGKLIDLRLETVEDRNKRKSRKI
jgi:hypothetical protein